MSVVGAIRRLVEPETPDEPPSATINSGTLATAVRNPRRRYVVGLLAGKEEMSRRELTEEITSIETDDPDSAARKRVYVSLQQVHLHKLDKWGIVEYDADRGTVVPGRNMDAALWAIDALDELGTGWETDHGMGEASTR